MGTWIASHIGSVLPVSVVAAGAGGWISRHLSGLSGKITTSVAALDADVLGQVHNPAVKAFLLKVEQAVDDAIPGAGDAKYAALAALITHDLPPSAAPFAPVLEAVLTAIGTGAKAGIAQAITPPAGENQP